MEYTNYKREEIKYIIHSEDAPDKKFGLIMDLWREMSRDVGDVGSCVIGAYLEMDYKGQKYRIHPQSPWQGSMSWEEPMKFIIGCFERIGAENVYYIPGRLD